MPNACDTQRDTMVVLSSPTRGTVSLPWIVRGTARSNASALTWHSTTGSISSTTRTSSLPVINDSISVVGSGWTVPSLSTAMSFLPASASATYA